MKRLFAAIKINPSTRFISLLNEISSSLHHERIRWVQPGNMHLTLKFFGETDEKRIPDIILALENSTQNVNSFLLKIENTGIFGSHYDPKVIWFGTEKQTELELLALNIFTNLEKYGFLADRQNFVPHLTIGRIKELKDKNLFRQIISKYASVEIQEERVNEVMLFESILRREGPLYEKVFSAKLLPADTESRLPSV